MERKLLVIRGFRFNEVDDNKEKLIELGLGFKPID